MSLAFATISALREKLSRREITPAELLSDTLARAKKYDPQIKSAIEWFDAASITDLHEGPLGGIPGILKDNICQKGRAMTCGSNILHGYQAPYDATVVERLKVAGAISVGRANCDEFAMGSSTETSAYFKTANPWDTTRVPGGSSGGSAAAVAAGIVPWALGSDTGGSVRQPAAFCGIVGSKPTYGRVSRYGLTAYGSSIDQIGVFTRTVADNALVFETIAGEDARDASTDGGASIALTPELTGTLRKGLTIGIVKNAFNAEGIDPDVRAALDEAVEQFKKLGARIIEVEVPAMDYGAAVYFMVSRAEAASNLARFDGVRYGNRAAGVQNLAQMYGKTRDAGFGAEVKRRILIGTYVLAAGEGHAYYDSAKAVQQLIKRDFRAAHAQADVLLIPTSPIGAFKFGAYDDNPLAMDLQDYFTAPINLAGIPAISIPCGFTREKLPIGLQVVGKAFDEATIFHVAHAYEQATEWHTMRPVGFE